MKAARRMLIIAVLLATPLFWDSAANADSAPFRPQASAERIEHFWKRAFAAISDEPFTSFRRLVVLAHGEDPPDCGDAEITARDLEGNALYCPKTDRVLLDADGFARPLLRDRGRLAITIVLAHEYGHAIQRRLGVTLPPVIAELQADCYAGSFAVTSVAGRADPDHRLTQPLLALLSLSDPLAAAPTRSAAHGTGFDRLAAFLDGFDRGVRRCRQYARRPPTVTSSSWSSSDDRDRRGELDPERIVPLFSADLDRHYQDLASRLGREWIAPQPATMVAEMPNCPDPDAGPPSGSVIWCGTDTMFVSTTELARLEQIGDAAVAADLGRAWAHGAQQQFPSTFSSDEATTECLTGVWLGTMHPGAHPERTGRMRLSPGDLDEVAEATLADPARPYSLPRLRALIDGFFVGLQECVANGSNG